MADRISILVVDDDPDTLYTLGQICRFKGWRALLADGYREAEAILAKHTPSLILVDYHMPGVDGIEAVSRIRKKLRHTPILVLTSDEQLQLMERFLAAGADDYALKPVRAPDLISRISAHLNFQEKAQFYTEYDKNITRPTLEAIEHYLQDQHDFVTIDQIVEGTQIKKKTAYRYLQYLIEKGRVESRQIYGQKGRPKVCHKWKDT